MSTKTITIFVCDRCRKEEQDPDIRRIHNLLLGDKDFELCHECFLDYFNQKSIFEKEWLEREKR